MKIAFFTDTYHPQINGVVSSIDSSAKHLRRLGHSVEIFSPASKELKGFRAITFAPYPEYKIGLPSASQIERFRRHSFDIVHVHTPISIGALGLGLAKHLGLPKVVTFHTLLPEYMHYLKVPGSLMKAGAWRYSVWFCNRADAVIAPSAPIAAELRRRGVTRPVHIVPTGIEQPGRRKPRARSGRTKTLLHVGRVTKEKHIDALVNALEKLPGHVRLVITSDGPYRSELESLVKSKGLQDRVRFTGYVSRPELEELYSEADLFVFASRTETQALVLAEAAAAGLPIVTTEAPVTADFVRKHGLGVVAKEKQLPAAIMKALQTRKAVSLPKGFSAAESAKNLLSVYKSVLSQKQAAP